MQGLKHEFSRDHQGNLNSLYISPKSTENCVRYHSVNKFLLLDSTYKTNKYHMPLLHGTGVSATNETFTLFYCFMRSETAECYIWAMRELKKFLIKQHIILPNSVFVTDRELALKNAIFTVFPGSAHMLCTWHISKNLLTKQRSSFDSEDSWNEFMDLWRALINSATLTEYNQRLEQLSQSVPPEVTTYLSSTWLCHKQDFVLAWTRHVMHFGHVTTSRVESAHAALKKWLQVSTGDILGVCSLLETACEEQERSLSQINNFQRTHNLVVCSNSLWRDVNKRISRHAMELGREQYLKSLAPNIEPCSNTFTQTMGIPCSHQIRQMRLNNTIFTINDFNKHWWLNQPEILAPAPRPEILSTSDTLLRIQRRSDLLMPHHRQMFLSRLNEIIDGDFEVHDPVTAPTRGRPTKSTRRDPSGFEYVEQSQSQVRSSQGSRSCRVCNLSGHNARTCPRRSQILSHLTFRRLRAHRMRLDQLCNID